MALFIFIGGIKHEPYHEKSWNSRSPHSRRLGDNMKESIFTALITSLMTLIGVLVSNNKNQAVNAVKIEELTREVREHNGFARRLPVVEEQIKVINHRIEDLEDIHKQDKHE